MRKGRNFLIFIIVALVFFGGAVGAVRIWYTDNLHPVSSSTTTQHFTVDIGSGVRQIADKLQAAGLIRNARVFETYARSNGYFQKLQAGTYNLSPSMSVQEIVAQLVSGQTDKQLFTILPGQRLDQLKAAFAKVGYSSSDISKAFNPATYAGDPALASKPSSASLEGYLYPDSFQRQSSTPASTIVKESLDEMYTHLTSDIIQGFSAHNLTIYQGITLASIVNQESGNAANQPIIAQVFYSRLALGMPLGSDVTAAYASQLAGQSLNLSINSPYNTRVNTGLPPGPISNVTASALKAVAHPAKTDYLYFLFGDDKKMHFAKTAAEHQANITNYCAKTCSAE